MSWKVGVGLDEEKIEKEEEKLRKFVKQFNERGPRYAFDIAHEYMALYAVTNTVNISDSETIVAINATGKAIARMIAENEEIDEECLKSINNLCRMLYQLRKKMFDNHKKFTRAFGNDSIPDYKQDVLDHADKHLIHIDHMLSLKKQSKVDEFKEHFQKHNPYSICRNMRRYVKCDETNPIIKLLNDNPFKSNEVIYLWSACIIDIFVAMGIAHIVHEGVNGRDFKKFAQLDDLGPIYSLKQEMRKFQAYKVDYWPEHVRALMQETADYEDSSNPVKAEYIESKLSLIENLDHGFLIIVHDKASEENENIFYGETENVLRERNRAGCGIIVYRTCFHKTRTEKEVAAMDVQAKEEKNQLHCTQKLLKHRVASFLHHCPLVGFVGAIKLALNPEVRLICAGNYNSALTMTTQCARPKTVLETIGSLSSGDVTEDFRIVVLPRQEPSPESGFSHSRFSSYFVH